MQDLVMESHVAVVIKIRLLLKKRSRDLSRSRSPESYDMIKFVQMKIKTIFTAEQLVT